MRGSIGSARKRDFDGRIESDEAVRSEADRHATSLLQWRRQQILQGYAWRAAKAQAGGDGAEVQ